MEVYENINKILLHRNITKRDFAKKLRAIEPKLKSTGEVPTEKAIYGYLNGTSNLKIELIPYIAEALNISEQELFTHKEIKKDTLYIKEPSVKYGKNNTQDMEKLISLLAYAPQPMMKELIEKLEKIKQISHQI